MFFVAMFYFLQRSQHVTMEGTSNKYLYNSNIQSVRLNSLYMFFLTSLISVAVPGDSPAPNPSTNSKLVNCGGQGNITAFDNRNWIGDNDNPLLDLQANGKSRVSESPFTYIDKVYLRARYSYSPFTYVFRISAGQKFIRPHFYPDSCKEIESSKDLFSVTASSFTLLSNFMPSRIAVTSGQKAIFKEFCIDVEEHQSLNITFTPDGHDAYAFINGIEISSMPANLYYTGPGDKPLKFLGLVNSYGIENSSALETVYRINIGGSFISPQDDTGLYRTWLVWKKDYLTDARPRAYVFNSSISLSFRQTPNYTAPVEVYKTAMSMGQDRNVNENYNLTLGFPVDCGFTYFVRLHFCEIQVEIKELGDRVFEIFIANQTAETQADVIRWSGANGVPVYRDYAVIIGSEGNEKQKNLTIKLHPAPRWKTKYSDAILNGLEIFKVDNNKNLAGDYSVPMTNPPKVVSLKNSKRAEIKISIIAVSSFMVIFIIILIIFWLRRKTVDSGSGAGVSMGPTSGNAESSESRGLTQPVDDLCTHFSLSEIKVATNNFDEILIIGVGGFGNVYKGWFIDNEATPVAIKRLNPGSQQGALEFKTEIEMLSQLRHRHLVSLIGYSDEDGEMILVYDYMARGTLRGHLYNTNNPPLPWNLRLQICIGAARGLDYLHTGARHNIIHRDVKTTNILLDERWIAKVSDFGLSKIGPTTMSQTHCYWKYCVLDHLYSERWIGRKRV
ncbi:receptor-like protein kinase FERONIA isoform X2 [Mangifera indica]|uniref:receptor-like protein kinase FERONIA isoform X2 n=1 Tax=Mangifera indica TaxID=29780 RepID=UPI001CFAAF2B|nr:receptor-like protein kinase FERONIA isoform X2 [Mangifera indica]